MKKHPYLHKINFSKKLILFSV
uniref:Uncharacterized protein n=1 Tax=Rhizophora mucronata TaxID=61149 RepID=A0A2P2NGK5_RHIMU